MSKPWKTVARCLRGDHDDAIDASSRTLSHGPDVELVMKIRGRFPELLHDLAMQVHGSFDDAIFEREHLVREASTQMAVQKRIIYHVQRGPLRHANGKSNKPPLQARVDEEAPGARVHARYHLCFGDGLDLRGTDTVPSRDDASAATAS